MSAIDSYALFGNPVAHSRSPWIHQQFAAQTDQRIEYTRQRVAPGRFQPAAAAFFAGGGCGLNITLPFKLDAFQFADALSERARQAAAVNTLTRAADGRIVGDNTDGVGMLRDMVDNLGWQLCGRRVLLLGAGGAVRGVLGPLLEKRPGSVVVANRTPQKARQLALDFGGGDELAGCGLGDLPGRQFDLVVNGTSASLGGKMPALPDDLLAADAVCYDMMYAASPTVFLRWADGQGAAGIADGLGMLVEQAAESFYIWRQRRPQTRPVIAALRQALGRGDAD